MKFVHLRRKLAAAEADFAALSREETDRLLAIGDPELRFDAYVSLRDDWNRSGDTLLTEDEGRLRASFASQPRVVALLNAKPVVTAEEVPVRPAEVEVAEPRLIASRAAALQAPPLLPEVEPVPAPAPATARERAAARRAAMRETAEPVAPMTWPWRLDERLDGCIHGLSEALHRLPRQPLWLVTSAFVGTAAYQVLTFSFSWLAGDTDSFSQMAAYRAASLGDAAWWIEGMAWALLFGFVTAGWMARRRGEVRRGFARRLGSLTIIGLLTAVGVVAAQNHRFLSTGEGFPAWPERLQQTSRGWTVNVDPRQGEWFQNRIVEPVFTEGVPAPEYALLRQVGLFGRTQGWWLVRPEDFRKTFGSEPAEFRSAPAPDRRVVAPERRAAPGR